MDKAKTIAKKNIPLLLKELQKEFKVVGPVARKDEFMFDEITPEKELRLDYDTTRSPPKKYLFPPVETILNYHKNEEYKIEDTIKDEKVMIFGIHPCDLNAINIMDALYNEQFKDAYYLNKRKNTSFIALTCTNPGEYCLCESMGFDKIEKGYDLLLTPMDDAYYVEIGSELGAKIASSELFEEAKEEPKPCKVTYKKFLDTENLTLPLEVLFKAPAWQEAAEKCIECGACTFYCPTCHCFDVMDEPTLDGKGAERKRIWDCCVFKDFCEISGGHNFREERYNRLRHRIMKKFCYFPARYGVFGCVGCGRCIKYCIVGIDFTEIIPKVKGEIA